MIYLFYYTVYVVLFYSVILLLLKNAPDETQC
jgi:hypothetical protein